MNSFLIVRLGSLGDVVHAIPLAAALRQHFPTARIYWMVDPRYVELLDMVTVVDGWFAVDPRAVLRARDRAAFFRAIREMRRARYDVAFDLQGLFKSAVLARAVKPRRIVGFPREHLREPLAGFFYTATPDPGEARHIIHKNLSLLAAVGVQERRAQFPLAIPRLDTVDAVARRFAPQGFVAVNPGAAWPNKRWPAARFGAVAAAVRRSAGLRSLVLWGPGERPLAQQVVDAAAGAAEAAPATSIPEIAGIAREARLMIAGDTGPMHLAVAVGTPVVALFGPTEPDRNGPWGLYDIAISRVERCSCVWERRCRLAAPCIEEIGVDEVLDAVTRRLAAHG